MTQTIRISLFRQANHTKSPLETDLNMFLEDIRNGKWQDIVIPIRAEADKDKRAALKKALPGVTISGLFNERKITGLKQHSGFIGIDIDDLGAEVESTRSVLSADPYVYAIFTSVSGTGLCVVFRIEGGRHGDAFSGLAENLHTNYGLQIDMSGRDASRLRFASYDPHIFINPNAGIFKRYPPKEKQKKLPGAVYVADDFTAMIAELGSKNICEAYRTWVTVGYALYDYLKEDGRQHFHTLSAASSKYDYADCDKLYSNIGKSYSPEGKDKTVTINYVFYHARVQGIEFYSDATKRILSSVTTLSRSGLAADAIAETLEKFDKVPRSISLPIITQAVAGKIQFTADSTVDKIESWLRYNYELTRNTITRKILVYNRELNNQEFNSIFIAARKVFDTDVTADLLDKLINSSFTPDWDPFKHFFTTNQHDEGGYLQEYIECFTTDNNEYFDYFFNKWLVGVISSALGQHSPLMLVYTGPQGSGKTQAFRDLLPSELSSYYAESKLDMGKDDEILMTQKLIICDDEMGGKSKLESRRIKELTSKQIFSLRTPYGRFNEDLRRLACLCGTTNDPRVKSDPTGNRRMVTTEVQKIDFKRINQVDRTKMIMEAYRLLQDGFTHHLTKEEQGMINKDKEAFNEYSAEYELIIQYYASPTGVWSEERSASEIKVHLERVTGQSLNLNRIGSELQGLGYRQEIKKVDGKTKRVYYVVEKTTIPIRQIPPF